MTQTIGISLLLSMIIQSSVQDISLECNTTKLSVIDESASNLFVIGDRRNRFPHNDKELSLFCSLQKSWVKNISDYIRECMPRFSPKTFMIRKLEKQIELQANMLCDPKQYPTYELYINTNCANKVINELHTCMENMTDSLSLAEDQVRGTQKLAYLCCSYFKMRNCSRHTLYPTVKHSCPNVVEWFDRLISGYTSKFIKQLCITRRNLYQTSCDSLKKLDKNSVNLCVKNRFKSILPAIIKTILTI